ncbi:hypothetical protein PoB_006129400 [Plakobranchus ocellatus]|uniref:Uncharacterized protein n=1 Tax=Plakobranchus ocellatus TaxID=259542 RepID=A0AAV4CSC4_9GAST|nr:hypothetical protein PoB_006129400 [Plakobranchus ocellatus]
MTRNFYGGCCRGQKRMWQTREMMDPRYLGLVESVNTIGWPYGAAQRMFEPRMIFLIASETTRVSDSVRSDSGDWTERTRVSDSVRSDNGVRIETTRVSDSMRSDSWD